MSAPDAAGVVVVAYANASTIDHCLDRLLAAKDVARIVVIDNASPDDTATRVARRAAHDRRLSIVCNERNSGFAAACNQGATAIAQPWIAFVNPDLYVEPDTFSRLLAHAINDRPDRTFAEVLAQVATQRGTVENVKDDSGESEGPAEPGAPLGARSQR